MRELTKTTLKMDVARFIELVRDRPCLYDDKHALSKNRKEKEKCWNEIAAAMEITSGLARCKWKNLKYYYTRHLKGTATSDESYLRYAHWNWAANMEFMKPHLHYTSSYTNGVHEEDELEAEYLDYAHSSTRSDEWSEDMPVDDKISQNSRAAWQDPFTPTRKSEQCMGEIDDYDATDLIFLGYAKAIKAFSVKRQAEIKLRFAKIIMAEELAHAEEISEYPQNSPSYTYFSSSPQHDPLNSKVAYVEIKTEDD